MFVDEIIRRLGPGIDIRDGNDFRLCRLDGLKECLVARDIVGSGAPLPEQRDRFVGDREWIALSFRAAASVTRQE
jgi:hypothetical protein